jgi:hypothetical protein
MRTIAESLEIHALIIYSHLVERINLQNFLLRWVRVGQPASCGRRESNAQVSYSQCLKASREPVSVISWQVTSRRFSSTTIIGRYDHIISADEAPTRMTHTIATQKTLLAVFLIIDGAILIHWLTPGAQIKLGPFLRKDTRATFRDPARGARCEILKADRVFWWCRTSSISCNWNCFQLCQFRHVPQPPYSPETSSCDFALFGDLERSFKGEDGRAPSESWGVSWSAQGGNNATGRWALDREITTSDTIDGDYV